MIDKTDLIQIKGIRDGLLISLSDAAWNDQQVALITQIDERQAFFQGARLALDVGNQALHVAELVNLRDMLSERGISLWAVLSDSPTTKNTAQLLGLATRVSKPRPQVFDHLPTPQSSDGTALWVNRTIRSGTRIEYSGNVIVLGDVNPGAEIIADGSVIVWGRLRGVVHAGEQGDSTAVVCALELAPTQLRIAGVIAILPTKKERPKPSTVHLKDGIFKAEPWQPGSA